MGIDSGISTSPIVFFGTGEFSLTVLRGLLEAGYDVAAVITKPDTRSGRGHKLSSPPVKLLAESYNIPVWQPGRLLDVRNQITQLGKPVGVLASYGKIIPQSIIDLFHPGIINIHPSLLPQYRGPSPIETAIKNGDSATGVSIMRLAAEMDAGPVYVTKSIPLTGKETKTELYHSLAIIGTNLLLETMPHIISGDITPLPQDDALATYTPLLSKADAALRPEALRADEAERLVRSHLGFPKTKLIVKGQVLIVTKAHVSEEAASPLDIACKDGKFLSVEELIAPSGRHMSAQEYLRGYLRA